MMPSERSLDLTEVALQSAISACSSDFFSDPIRESGPMSLAQEYAVALKEIEALNNKLHPPVKEQSES